MDEERRINDNIILEYIKTIDCTVKDLSEEIKQHVAEEKEMFQELFNKAFPDGDAEAHRATHVAWIKELEAKTRLKEALVEKIVTGGVWGAIVGIGYACWYWLKGNI